MGKKEELEKLLGKEIYKQLSEDMISRISIERAKGILEVLDEEKIGREILKTNGTILAYGEAGKIKEILKVLDEEKIGRDILKTNGQILSPYAESTFCCWLRSRSISPAWPL